MKKILITVTTLIIGFFSSAQNTNSDYQIIPKPTELRPEKGRFYIQSGTVISGDPALQNEGDYLTEMLNSATNFDFTYTNGDQGNILLKLDNSIAGDEAYTLMVSPGKIVISGKTPAGVFYGIQTLRQLLPASIESGKKIADLSVPAVSIKDTPRYVYRGMHLDVGRHFFPVDFIKEYIDLIAMHKMNTFHWHLTDDQGWRIEIKKYPKLTEVGAYRKGTLVGHGSTKKKNRKYDGKPYGGYYTQDEIRDIVAYAAKGHVTVIPEN